MKFKKSYQEEKGFSILLLDFLFIAAGIVLVIYGILSSKDILTSLASLVSIFK